MDGSFVAGQPSVRMAVGGPFLAANRQNLQDHPRSQGVDTLGMRNASVMSMKDDWKQIDP